jgi:hypothetical protein
MTRYTVGRCDHVDMHPQGEWVIRDSGDGSRPPMDAHQTRHHRTRGEARERLAEEMSKLL